MKFDFYLPDYHMCIEYDGEGHFRPIAYNNQDNAQLLLEYAQENDQIKNEYCIFNNIPLLRIDYTQKAIMTDILTKWFIR